MKRLLLFILLFTSLVSLGQSPRYIFHGQNATHAGGGTSYDVDAQALITAITGTGQTLTTTQQNGIDRFFRDLKGQANGSYSTYNIYTKFKALYLMIGTTAASQKFNAVSPVDADANFRLTWSGTVTHTAGYAAWDGSTGYADTHLTPSSVLSLNDVCIAYFTSTNNTTSNQREMGTRATAGNDFLLMTLNGGSGDFDGYANDGGFFDFSITQTNAFWMVNRASSTTTQGFKNGVSLGTSAVNSGSLSTHSIYLGACPNSTGTAANFSNKNCYVASISTHLADGTAGSNNEALAFYNAILALNTALGR